MFSVCGSEGAFWKAADVPLEGWIAQLVRRYPSGGEPACPRCGKGFRDVLLEVFHPGFPEYRGEICQDCFREIGDSDFPVPEVLETWAWLDLVAYEAHLAGGSVGEAVDAAFLEVEGMPLPVGAEPAGKVVEGDPFEAEDFSSLEGKGWRVSSKGNLFSHQRDFHVVIFPAREGSGFRVMIDGVVGQCVYADLVKASANVVAGVQELLCRGVVAQRLLEASGGKPVNVQREMMLR